MLWPIRLDIQKIDQAEKEPPPKKKQKTNKQTNKQTKKHSKKKTKQKKPKKTTQSDRLLSLIHSQIQCVLNTSDNIWPNRKLYYET
jgi:hypothetical protein